MFALIGLEVTYTVEIESLGDLLTLAAPMVDAAGVGRGITLMVVVWSTVRLASTGGVRPSIQEIVPSVSMNENGLEAVTEASGFRVWIAVDVRVLKTVLVTGS